MDMVVVMMEMLIELVVMMMKMGMMHSKSYVDDNFTREFTSRISERYIWKSDVLPLPGEWVLISLAIVLLTTALRSSRPIFLIVLFAKLSYRCVTVESMRECTKISWPHSTRERARNKGRPLFKKTLFWVLPQLLLPPHAFWATFSILCNEKMSFVNVKIGHKSSRVI